MADIKIAFWNLENLFDTQLSPLAADFDFTPEHGWDQAALDAKLANLAHIIGQMHGGTGPDLLGICEVENAAVAQALIDALHAATGRADYRLAHVDSPDIRGIDVSLIYSNQVFRKPKASEMKGHMVHLRYPTRDIFAVRLRLLGSEAELLALVNHWPSRKQGKYASEPYRMTVAAHCGRLVDDALLLPRDEFLALPNAASSLALLNERWNRNVLVMGDFNDEPYDRSLLDYLLGAKDLDHLDEELKRRRASFCPRRARTWAAARTCST
jgi:hypothetical protein